MKPIAIYGAGGFGREVALMIEQINQAKTWDMIGFFDDGMPLAMIVDGHPVIGGMEELNQMDKPLSVAVAIADPETRLKIVSKITNPNIDFPVLIHPQALAGSALNVFSKGCIITAGCIITTGVVLHEFVILNLSTTIGHDVHIGKCTTIMPGCNISGNIAIGEASMIGTGVQVIQNLSIGNHTRVGAGAVVTKSFGDGVTVVGVPAKIKQ